LTGGAKSKKAVFRKAAFFVGAFLRTFMWRWAKAMREKGPRKPRCPPSEGRELKTNKNGAERRRFVAQAHPGLSG